MILKSAESNVPGILIQPYPYAIVSTTTGAASYEAISSRRTFYFLFLLVCLLVVGFTTTLWLLLQWAAGFILPFRPVVVTALGLGLMLWSFSPPVFSGRQRWRLLIDAHAESVTLLRSDSDVESQVEVAEASRCVCQIVPATVEYLSFQSIHLTERVFLLIVKLPGHDFAVACDTCLDKVLAARHSLPELLQRTLAVTPVIG